MAAAQMTPRPRKIEGCWRHHAESSELMLDFDKAGPQDPDASTAWVYLLYGATMSGVQVLEHSLAFLSLVVTTDPNRPREGSARDQIPGVFERWWRAYQKDTAGRTLGKIKSKIPADLYSDLDAFFERRNWLAHRFFIAQLEGGEDGSGRFAQGTVAKLTATYVDATKLTERVETYGADTRAAWPKSPEQPPPAFVEWAEEFTQLVMRRRVRPDVLAAIRARQTAAGQGGE